MIMAHYQEKQINYQNIKTKKENDFVNLSKKIILFNGIINILQLLIIKINDFKIINIENEIIKDIEKKHTDYFV